MITTLLLAAVSIAFGFYVYKNPPTKPAHSPEKICMDYSKGDISELSLPLVHEMVHGYRDNQLAKINASSEFSDAHSIWFDLETLKKFMYHLEISAKKNDVSSKELGLRIYYSRYPLADTWQATYPDLVGHVDPAYQEHHTLVMIPTIKKQGKNGVIDMDFNPIDKTTYEKGLKKIEGDINPKIRIPALSGIDKAANYGSANLKIATKARSIIAQNHGSLIPPKDNSGEGFV